MITPELKDFEQLSEALPSSFGFYHLGTVELQPDWPHPTQESPLGVSFRLQGDLNALFVLLLDENLDLAIYSELGNILASKIANQLFADRQLQITISPPQALSENQLALILENEPATIRKTYVHRFDNKIIYLETLFMSHHLEGIGNA